MKQKLFTLYHHCAAIELRIRRCRLAGDGDQKIVPSGCTRLIQEFD